MHYCLISVAYFWFEEWNNYDFVQLKSTYSVGIWTASGTSMITQNYDKCIKGVFLFELFLV